MQDESTGWKLLYHTDNAKGPQASDSKQHVVHNIIVGTDAERDAVPGVMPAQPNGHSNATINTSNNNRYCYGHISIYTSRY